MLRPSILVLLILKQYLFYSFPEASRKESSKKTLKYAKEISHITGFLFFLIIWTWF